MTTYHAMKRIEERLINEASFHTDKVENILKMTMDTAMRRPYVRQAIYLGKLPKKIELKMVGKPFSIADELWAIVRDNRIITMMFRSSKKPKTPNWFSGVDVVTSAI